MYRQTFSRITPGCVVLLLDRSDSMRRRWGNSGLTLAEGAARAINGVLMELCVKATKEQGGALRHYFDIGIFGYGLCPSTGQEGVEPAFGGALAGRAIVPLPELAMNPLAIRDEPSVDDFGPGSRMPVWIEPMHGSRTPMCQAIAVVGEHVYGWAQAHPDSFPPIVINITDGLVTDSPYDGADLHEWARRLQSIETRDGSALMLNIFLSDDAREPDWFPARSRHLPAPGPQLFAISSPLPQRLIDNARAARIDLPVRARGLVFNADLSVLVKFLEIGTRFDVVDR